jgi:hypothetical protein
MSSVECCGVDQHFKLMPAVKFYSSNRNSGVSSSDKSRFYLISYTNGSSRFDIFTNLVIANTTTDNFTRMLTTPPKLVLM